MNGFSLKTWICVGVLLGWLGCDSPVRPAKDAGPDVPDHVDVVDVPDVPDVVDVPDVTDGPDADVDPDAYVPLPGCATDPHQRAIGQGLWTYGAYYPYVWVPIFNYSNYVTTMNAYHLETGQTTALFQLDYKYRVQAEIVFEETERAIWFTANYYWLPEDTGVRPSPKLLKYYLDTGILEDVSGMFPTFFTPDCEEYLGLLDLVSIDYDHNRLLLSCFWNDEATQRQFVNIYHFQLSTGEIEILGSGVDAAFLSRSCRLDRRFGRHKYVVCYYNDWPEDGEANIASRYWRIDGDQATWVWDSYDPDHARTWTDWPTMDDQVLYVKKYDEEYRFLSHDLNTGAEITLPWPGPFPNGVTPIGEDFPSVVSWAESWDMREWTGKFITHGYRGFTILWDRDTGVLRQATCLDGVGFYSTLYLVPGDPTGRYALVKSSADILFVKDMISSGLIGPDGHLLPPPEK